MMQECKTDKIEIKKVVWQGGKPDKYEWNWICPKCNCRPPGNALCWEAKMTPLNFQYCDFTNCENNGYYGLAGDTDQDPSQWCKQHYHYVLKQLETDPAWVRKFQKGEKK